MRKTTLLICLLFTSIFYAQTFNGTAGAISDNGTTNEFTALATGLPGTLSTDLGLVQVCLTIPTPTIPISM